MQRDQLSERTRGILFTFKKLLKQNNMALKQLVVSLFQFQKEKFKKAEFTALIKEMDQRLSYEDIDHIWTDLDSNANGFIFLNDLLGHLNSITEEDDPFRNRLDRQSRIIAQNRQQAFSQEDQIVLLLKEFKDMLKDTDPWQLFDIFDEDRDGKLELHEFIEILKNFEIPSDKGKLLIKGIFKDKRKCQFENILAALGLENIGKRVDFDEAIDKKSYIQEPNLLNSIRRSKVIPQQKKIEKPVHPQNGEVVVPFSEIPEVIQPYFNYSSQMTEPFLSQAMAQLISNSVYFDPDNPHSSHAHRWEHISKIFRGGYHLFEDRGESILQRSKQRTGLGLMMDSNNIIQGGVGDCYLMSAIAGIVEHYPELIYGLFLMDKNPVSMYAVRLFIDGVWETIVCDARFPVNFHGKFIYAKPYKHEIWVMILEKAWAKLYKSYENINSGYSDEGLTAITGAPCLNFDTDQEGIIEKTPVYLNKGYIISCSGSEMLGQLTPQEQEQMGIFSSHAYTVITLHQNLEWRGRKVTLIKVRNPWGRKAWKGDWSFSSGTWTNQLREKLKYNKDPNDGTFYMNLEDYMTYFDRLTVCFVSLGKVNSTIKLTSNRQHSVMVSFNVKSTGDYFFSIYQENRRKYKSSGNYDLSKSRFFLGKLVKGCIEAVSSKSCIKSNLHVESTLDPGDYIISCKVKWNYKEVNSFHLTSYGPDHISFNEIPKDKNFIKEFILNRAQLEMDKNLYTKNHKKTFYAKHPLNTSFKVICIEPKQGYGYILVRNNSNFILSTQISFSHVKGLKPLKPESFPLDLFVAPQSEVVRCLLCDSEGYSYEMSEVYSLQ